VSNQQGAPVLKPCPFCGCNNITTVGRKLIQMKCLACGSFSGMWATYAEAKAAWNRRAP
jgi:Lar family restriction alleviation protein